MRLKAIAAAAGLALYALLLAAPLSRGGGLPSYAGGFFHTATIAYYVEAARLILEDGWWTDKACLGFQDLARFYPPLPLAILALLLDYTGDPGAASSAAYTIALALLATAIYSLARALGAGGLRALAAPLAVLAVPGYVGSIAVYWEYSRVLGDALALLALSMLTRGLTRANAKDVAGAGVLAGLTVLTSLVSVQWLAAASAATLAAWLVSTYRAGVPEALASAARGLGLALLASTAVAGWWLVPALLPWGLSHYLRVETGLDVKLRVLAESLHPAPDPSIPALSAPLALLALASLALARGNRGGAGLAAAQAVAVLAYAMAYGQGTRLIPVAGLLLALAPLALPRGRTARLAAIAWLAVAAPLAAYYYTGAYTRGLTPDYSYIDSDEYKVAMWLAAEPPEGFVYLMYGPVFHGNQWIHVFNPGVRQVLSHYMEGCLNPTVFEVDYYIKETLNAPKTYQLLVENNITLLVVDAEWMKERHTVIEELEAQGLLTPASINPYLEHARAYHVARPPDAPPPQPPPVRAYYWTPARLLGATVTLTALYALHKAGRRRG